MIYFCNGCVVMKDESEFHRMGGQRRPVQSRCKICQKEEAARRYIIDREEILARTTAYAKANPHVPKKAASNYRANNYEAVKERDRMQRHLHPELFKARDSAWGKNNKGKVAAKAARRRAGRLKATPVWADPQEIKDFYKTAEALGMHTGEWYHVDHIVPLNSKLVCGLHCPENLQVLPGAENLSKSNRRWPDMPA